MRCRRRIHVAPLLIVYLAFTSTPLDAVGQPVSQKSVRFFVNAKSDFDRWTERPTRKEQAWMREHYDRMLTYSPYFDSRLKWYPNGWVYKDSYAIRASWDIFEDQPEWVLRDAAGNMLYIPFGCSGGKCPQYAGDVGNPAFRRWWIEGLRRKVEKGYIGIWIDDVNLDWRVSNGRGKRVKPIDPRTGVEMTLNDWRRYFAEFMEEVREAFPDVEIAHNVIWYANPPDDPHILRQIAAADYINLERGATDDGIRGGSGKYGYETFLAFIDHVHAQGKHVILDDDDSDTLVERDYELATYLLINDGSDLVGADGDRNRMNPHNFWQGYKIGLGRASGPRFVVNNLFRRDYDCGSVILNQPEMPKRRLDVGNGFMALDGTAVTSVTLEASTAAILLKKNCTDAK